MEPREDVEDRCSAPQWKSAPTSMHPSIQNPFPPKKKDSHIPIGCMNSNQSAISQNLHFEDARAFSRPHWVVVKHTARQRWVLARLEEDCLLGQRLREHSFGREGNASSVVRGCYAYDVIISIGTVVSIENLGSFAWYRTERAHMGITRREAAPRQVFSMLYTKYRWGSDVDVDVQPG